MTSSLLGADGCSGTKRNMLPDVGDDVEASRDAPRRKVFHGSLLLFLLQTLLRVGGCRSVRRRRERLAHWRAGHASGIRTIETSKKAGTPFQVRVILPEFQLSFAIFWNALTWT